MQLPGNNEQICGTCSLCGGPVVLPIAWWSVVPPQPTCKECGAVAKTDYGPVIPMQPAPKWVPLTEIQINPDGTGGTNHLPEILPGTGGSITIDPLPGIDLTKIEIDPPPTWDPSSGPVCCVG